MLRHIFSNWVGLLVLGVISVVLTPVMVHGLGNVYYGMWALVASLVDYSGLLDMGMRATVFRYVAYFKGANQRLALNQTFATGLVIAFAMMFLCIFIFAGLTFVLPSFFKVTGAYKSTFSWVVVLMGTSIAVALPGQFLSAYLRGLERFDLYNWGMITNGIVRGSLLFTLIKLGFGIVSVSAAVLGSAVVSLAFHWLLVKLADRDLEVSVKYLDWKRTREMFNFGFYSFVNNSGESLRFSTDSFVIGRMLTVALVTPFSVATRLTDYFKMLISGVSGPIMVRLSELSGKDQVEELREEFLRSTRFSMLLSIFIGGMLILNGKILIRLWIGPQYLVSYPLLVVLTLAYIATWGQLPCQLLIFARASYHKALSWWTLAEGATNLLLSILWAKKYGLLGVALGTAIPLIISKLFIQPWYAMRDLDMNLGHYLGRGTARPVIAGCVSLACSWLLVTHAFLAVNYLTFALSCTLQMLTFSTLIYLFGLADTDKDTVTSYGWRIAALLGMSRVE